jgi:hypothetical protein
VNVLVGHEFAYWGGDGPVIPKRFRNFKGYDVCAGRGHKNNFPDLLVRDFVNWVSSLGESGCVHAPLNW